MGTPIIQKNIPKTAFTKGPWTNDGEDIVAPEVPCIRIMAPFGKGEREVCSVSAGFNSDTEEFFLSEEEKANAHLIKASPRMYEALQRVVAEYSQDTTAEPIGALIARIDNANHFIQEVLKEARGENV